jgi:hydrogenase-4 component B
MWDIRFLYLSIFITLAGIAAIPFLPSRVKSVFTGILVFINALLTTFIAVNVLSGNSFAYLLSGLGWFGKIPLRIDPLSAWFIVIINFTCVNGILYGIGYMKKYSVQKANLTLHWSMYLLFHTSMLWVCVVQNTVAFLIIWELMSFSSLLLVIFESHKGKTLKAGINYLVQMHMGVALLTTAFIWVGITQYSFDFNAIHFFFKTHSNLWLFILLFTGFAVKAGIIPLHSWLPHAHPAAPSHISGVMSGVIVKLGIYGIFRTITYLEGDFKIIGEIVLILSLATGLFGIINSAVHRDYKKMLAYCTIENIGIIGIGIGLGIIGMGKGNQLLIVLGFGGALLHTLNHSLFKSLLFFSAGSVYLKTHTRDMEKLGGLIKKMPITAWLFLIGALAVGGLPPFNGFVSEFIIYIGLINGIITSGAYHSTLLVIALAGLAIIGGVSILAFTKAFGTIFLGTPRSPYSDQPVEVSFGMLMPQYLIVLVILLIGIFPSFFFQQVINIVSSAFPVFNTEFGLTLASTSDLLSSIGKYSFVFLLLIIGVLLTRKIFSSQQVINSLSTWGCGYISPDSRMQYTGKSYSKSLGKLLSFFLLEKKKYKEITPEKIFPQRRKHSSHYADFFENRIIDKITNQLNYFMNLFQFIQNGRTQMYILYGLFFILVVFLGTILKFI